jgi:hypothetical protein
MQQASLPRQTPLAPLLPGDSLVASIERIWGLKPSVIEVSIGTSNDPYSADPTDWVKTAMTRTQAALALRTARAENLLIEQSRTGYVISGGFRL